MRITKRGYITEDHVFWKMWCTIPALIGYSVIISAFPRHTDTRFWHCYYQKLTKGYVIVSVTIEVEHEYFRRVLDWTFVELLDCARNAQRNSPNHAHYSYSSAKFTKRKSYSRD